MLKIKRTIFTKLIDVALGASFLAVHLLSKLRNRIQFATPAEREEERLMAEWVDARRKRVALESEMDRPTASREYGGQAKLFQATNAAKVKCRRVLVALRAHRKAEAIQTRKK